MENRKFYTCCFIGHRKIVGSEKLIKELYNSVEKLITDNNVDTFLFGSKSEFNDVCLEIVTKLKEKYSHIKRVYVRAEYQFVDERYTEYLLRRYDETYFPNCVDNAGRNVYVKRNIYMIDNADYCIFYYLENYVPNGKRIKSGTATAYKYAEKQNKRLLNIVTLLR